MADTDVAQQAGTDGPVLTRRSLVATVLGCVLFAIVAMTVSAVHRANTPRPQVAVLDEKIADYQSANGAYDIVFLGSSQTFRHIDPATIDGALAQCGLGGVSTYNFGVPALREPELRYIADAVLAMPDRPRLLVLQNPIRAETVFSNMMSARGRFFRGGDRVGAALQDVQCYTGTRAGQARSLFNNLRVIIAETFGLGRLAEALVPADPPVVLEYNEGYRARAGFWPVDQDGSDHVVDRTVSSPMTSDILARGRAGVGFTPSAATADCRAAQLTETFREFEDEGVQTAYFVSPAPLDVAHDRPITDAVAALNPETLLLDFNSGPDAMALFEASLWYDGAHMTGEGAAQLSEAIAERLCQALQD